jgi:hypothetical protein
MLIAGMGGGCGRGWPGRRGLRISPWLVRARLAQRPGRGRGEAGGGHAGPTLEMGAGTVPLTPPPGEGRHSRGATHLHGDVGGAGRQAALRLAARNHHHSARQRPIRSKGVDRLSGAGRDVQRGRGAVLGEIRGPRARRARHAPWWGVRGGASPARSGGSQQVRVQVRMQGHRKRRHRKAGTPSRQASATACTAAGAHS